jgi:hypothetical protein
VVGALDGKRGDEKPSDSVRVEEEDTELRGEGSGLRIL